MSHVGGVVLQQSPQPFYNLLKIYFLSCFILAQMDFNLRSLQQVGQSVSI